METIANQQPAFLWLSVVKAFWLRLWRSSRARSHATSGARDCPTESADTLIPQAGSQVPTEFTRPKINRDERMLWIHAGPHKAASSYVTERLRQNREYLAAQGVLMDGDDNRLANSIAEKTTALLRRLLPRCLPVCTGFCSAVLLWMIESSAELCWVNCSPWLNVRDSSWVSVISSEISSPG